MKTKLLIVITTPLILFGAAYLMHQMANPAPAADPYRDGPNARVPVAVLDEPPLKLSDLVVTNQAQTTLKFDYTNIWDMGVCFLRLTNTEFLTFDDGQGARIWYCPQTFYKFTDEQWEMLKQAYPGQWGTIGKTTNWHGIQMNFYSTNAWARAHEIKR